MSDYRNYFVEEHIPASEALWRINSLPERTIFVIDSREGKVIGYANRDSFPPFSPEIASARIGEICRRDVKTVPQTESYRHGRNIMADFPSIRLIPIVDEKGCPINVLRRWQLFFKDEYFRAVRTVEPIELPYPQYAACIWRAAQIAQSVGASKFLVMEFGVGKGDGLVACELICEAVARIFQLGIEVIGFDNGTGLPAPEDWRDAPQCWANGLFRMSEPDLRSRLGGAKLVLGAFAETIPAFEPAAPIGVMLVDCDFYSSATHILKMLEGDAHRFLPIVSMYFDDIGGALEFQGEALAITEFNARSRLRKISPERESFGEYNFGGRRYGFSKLKACLFFDHPDFSDKKFATKIMHDFWR